MKWTIFFLCSILFFSCDLLNQAAKNPVFSDTTFIDRCSPVTTVSTSMPDFKWNSPGDQVSYEVIGVFNSTIVVSDKKIVNTNACIAMWTTGMTGSAGNINFSYFQKVSNGILLSANVDSSTLTSNTTYHWAVWGYNTDSEISHSSGDNQFKWQ